MTLEYLKFISQFEENQKRISDGYEEILIEDTWWGTHILVANHFLYKQKLKEIFRNTSSKDWFVVVHHKDFNKLNNHPSNLRWMGNIRHFKLHSNISGGNWSNPIFKEKMLIAVTKNWENAEYREIMRDSNSRKNKINWKNKDYRNKMSKIISESNKERWKDNTFKQDIIAKQSASALKNFSDPEYKLRMSKIISESNKRRALLKMQERNHNTNGAIK